MDINGGPCELCSNPGGEMLWASSACRAIRVADPHYPGFCRVVWNAHVREMSDLDPAQQQYLMSVVLRVERVVRELYAPDKINLASFGNVVPHLHWHVIPRWRDDRHFPEPVWGKVQRELVVERPLVDTPTLASALEAALDGLEAP